MITLTLPNMTCQHCVRAVTQAAHEVDSTAKLNFDLVQHQVDIESDKPRQAFVDALAEEGYVAQSD